MGVNGVTEVTNNIATTYTSTVNAPVEDKKKDSEVKVKAEAAAVYEKSEDSSAKTSVANAKEADKDQKKLERFKARYEKKKAREDARAAKKAAPDEAAFESGVTGE